MVSQRLDHEARTVTDSTSPPPSIHPLPGRALTHRHSDRQPHRHLQRGIGEFEQRWQSAARASADARRDAETADTMATTPMMPATVPRTASARRRPRCLSYLIRACFAASSACAGHTPERRPGGSSGLSVRGVDGDEVMSPQSPAETRRIRPEFGHRLCTIDPVKDGTLSSVDEHDKVG